MARENPIQYVNFYTAGSAAYKFEPTPLPKKKATLPRMRRKKRILVHVDPMVVMGMAVAVVLLVMMVGSIVTLTGIRAQEAEMAAYVEKLQQENVQLQAEYKAGYDLDEIREIAEAMGMVSAGEAERVTVSVTAPAVREEVTLWEKIGTFLAGLFA